RREAFDECQKTQAECLYWGTSTPCICPMSVSHSACGHPCSECRLRSLPAFLALSEPERRAVAEWRTGSRRVAAGERIIGEHV
ncbi:hypothetical protein, partial [Escherichia coli]|uniref:hypothetical protein n=1 Tax=Escherichia coli TaxID=562 RepID=UPI00290573B8